MQCAEIVHGATDADTKPPLDGLWSTIVSNASNKQVQNYIENNSVVCLNQSFQLLKKVSEFESSIDNAARSLKVLYNGGLISKSKYKDIRLASSFESKSAATKKTKGRINFMEGIPIPRILAYDKLIRGSFKVAKGADGAPFVKEGEATACQLCKYNFKYCLL